MFFRISLIALLSLLVACNQAPREAAPTTTTLPSAGTSVVVSPSADANVIFTATPASIRRCDAVDGNATVSLAWDVRPASITFVTIMVGDRVFAEGTSNGTSTTGPWVRDDTVFTLVDAATKKPLTTLQIPFVDCEG